MKEAHEIRRESPSCGPRAVGGLLEVLVRGWLVALARFRFSDDFAGPVLTRGQAVVRLVDPQSLLSHRTILPGCLGAICTYRPQYCNWFTFHQRIVVEKTPLGAFSK